MLVGSSGRPRRPAVQNSALRSALLDGASPSGSPAAVSGPAPPPRRALNQPPVLSLTTTPNDTSPRRASSDGGTTAIDTQHDSSPAAAGRVPSIGSTTRKARGWP